MSAPKRNTFAALAAVGLLAAGAIGYWLWSRNGLPAPGSPEYEQYVDAFQVGLAALDSNVTEIAEEKLTQAVKIIPGEPAGWADRGIVYLRSGRLKEAAQDLNEAIRLAPDRPEIQKLVGLLEQRRGRFDEAASWLQKAIRSDPK